MNEIEDDAEPGGPAPGNHTPTPGQKNDDAEPGGPAPGNHTPTPSPIKDDEEPGVQVDARGLRCPLPIIRLAAAARTAAPGTVITLLSTDPAAEPDVAAWCRMRHQTLLTQTWSTGTLTSQIHLTHP